MSFFEPHRLGQTRRQSLAALIRSLLANRTDPVILEKHIRDLLDTALWKYTEADGKYNTRYKSAAALQCRDEDQLRHEHVYPRSKLIDALLLRPEELERVLFNAIGCTVTKDEHSSLTPFDKKYPGWERYRQASVTVVDAQTGQELSLDDLVKLSL